MKDVLYRSYKRGHADHGWLKASHSFSFAGWYDETRVNFGTLRVFNDDTIAPGSGFGMHPHENMEIITIPLRGVLEHKDNMGNSGQIRVGEVQVMSAGTGVYHSEYNPSKTDETELFQVWIFPKEKDILPRYEMKSFDASGRENRFQLLISPLKTDRALWINQDAFVSMGRFANRTAVTYDLHRANNGIFMMVIEGNVFCGKKVLMKRDSIEITDIETLTMEFLENSEVLIVEVPMI